MFNTKTKLLSSLSIVNGKEYQSKTNMYEKVYKGIYENLIIPKPMKRPYKWYDRFQTGLGLTYTWRGEISPSIYLGYGINIRELMR